MHHHIQISITKTVQHKKTKVTPNKERKLVHEISDRWRFCNQLSQCFLCRKASILRHLHARKKSARYRSSPHGRIIRLRIERANGIPNGTIFKIFCRFWPKICIFRPLVNSATNSCGKISLQKVHLFLCEFLLYRRILKTILAASRLPCPQVRF